MPTSAPFGTPSGAGLNDPWVKIADWGFIGPALLGRNVLDLGCSYPIDALLHAPFAAAWTAVDVPAVVAWCQEHWKFPFPVPVTFFPVDLQKSLPFRDGTFEVVLDMSTVDDIPAESRDNAYSEARRVLRHGGLLLVAYGNRDHAPGAAYYDASLELERRLRRAGFVITRREAASERSYVEARSP